ncbi:MAG TPA: glycosyltransferase [Bryobacteraceae bacterium]|nr:glycosyltransferase [Bryobacteraceae bacterium]
MKTRPAVSAPSVPSKTRMAPAALAGVLVTALGLIICACAAIGTTLALLLGFQAAVERMHFALLVSGLLLLAGLCFVLLDLFYLLPSKFLADEVPWSPILNPTLTVVLTAYNDEACIGQAVRDFIGHPLVRRVIAVDNNSIDGTAAAAGRDGAIVVCEMQPGYGRCVYRALSEGLRYDDTELTLLCEGDMTFRARDIDKFLAYIPHADIVNGTRIVEQLRARPTQLTTFMYYGNFFVGKLLELKHLGKGTFTDVGTTYKLCRNDALRRLMPNLNPAINLEFNAHFMDMTLQTGLRMLECPITFHNRVGVSKGGNVNNRRAVGVGSRMILGILFGWKRAAAATSEGAHS